MKGSSLRKFFLASVPSCWQRVLQSRPIAKVSKFYFAFCAVLVVELIYSVKLRHDLLDPHENSPFFDFVATTVQQTSLAVPSCAVARGFHPFEWRGLSPWISNYLLYPRIIGGVCWALGIAAAFSLVLAFASRHFQYIPRARYARPGAPQLLFGAACKQLPRMIRVLFFAALALGGTALFLVHGLHSCDNRLPDIGAPSAKIRNCRLWLRVCAGDSASFGPHLDCALRENYSAFSRSPCESDSGSCGFMRGDSVVVVDGGICAGELLGTDVGGPLPRCPMCRTQRPSGSYQLSRGRSLLELDEEPGSLLETMEEPAPAQSPPAQTRKRRSSTGSRRRDTEDSALSAAYLQTLQFYSQGSHLSLSLDYWALTLALVAVGYALADNLRLTTTAEGYFRRAPAPIFTPQYAK